MKSILSFDSQTQTKMIYRNLGSTGLRVSVLSLGTDVTFGNQIPDEMAEKIITMAYTSGINVFETGEAYSNGEAERTLGRILTAKNWRRSSYIVCCRLSKSGEAETEKGLSRKHLFEGLRSSLERLQLEYVDIVIVTRQRDSPIPVEEVVRTCTHFIHLGWTFYWGTSEWLPCEIMQAQTVARQFNLIPPSVDQNELNLLNKSHLQNMREICLKLNIGIMTGSPLSGGILTGKYIDCIPSFSRATLKNQQSIRDKLLCSKGICQREQVRQLCKIASRIECTCAQLAIAWCLHFPLISSVVIGAATIDQLQENIRSVFIYPNLTASIISELDSLLTTTDSNDNFL
ncbi:Voltage-gated potassium channel subunit beta-2 isoform 2 [Schistosoma japonicum]|uniref:Voltage-gated potassium channel subunit beta-2 isoform 2 n=2 Tax=Schistosoma japonicum TaxID=6182 RepID=A0A4Z2DNM2_SCHJA|nr:Voltage-gated potassium channel subunit beta-2 [Schistosoma japonicum]TNN18018.1 Voltage-gated potassium channel subunit beta-2 isoform 2 [Schistosoma japonicum]